MPTLNQSKNDYLQGNIDDCQAVIDDLNALEVKYDIFNENDLEKLYGLRNSLENRITLYKASMGATHASH